ncbi:MAG TPA: alpha/beta hydrolase [Terriglobales bacterium]|nr:alpha/beta hydrolase [Terriglobales bacterium]
MTERVLLSLVTLVALAAAASTTFNVAAHDVFLAHHPAPGQIYVVNAYKMHLWCMGQGSPAIVLESGLGFDSLVWGTVQPELSKTTRVCSYDRAGTGWSESQPGARDSDHIVEQLHGLLQQAGITGPIVLMGHSIAGIHMRAYVTRYPENVKGIVFVDGSTPLQQERGSPELRAAMSSTPWSEFALYAVAVNLGVLRMMGMFSHPSSKPGWGVGSLQTEDEWSAPVMTDLREVLSFLQDGRETIHTGPYGDLPILIFSQDSHSTEHDANLSPKLTAELSSAWDQMQEDLKKLSTRSRRIIAKGSGHFIQLNRTDLVLKEVPLFIEQVRGNAPPPKYGTTTTE